MANRNPSHDYAETEVLPAHLAPGRIETLDSAAAEAQGRYQEYLRSLEEVPVLVDVVREPPRAVIKDFRLGQRADARKAPRDDASLLREQHVYETERHYAEYVAICAALDSAACAPSRKGGPKRKRAKRKKRSARSKH